MDVTPLIKEGQQIIQSYAAGRFKISGISYDHPVIVAPNETNLWPDAPDKIEDFDVESLRSLLAHASEIDVLLVGTGSKMHFISQKIRTDLSALGLAIDVMDTGAACRTYNVLVAEGRRVVAVMMPFVE